MIARYHQLTASVMITPGADRENNGDHVPKSEKPPGGGYI